MHKDIRWKQRFDNYKTLLDHMETVFAAFRKDPENPVNMFALIQTFNLGFELAWKLMKDFLLTEGLDPKFPSEVLKEAFATKIIEDGQVWFDMRDHRNKMAHFYDIDHAKELVEIFSSSYLPAFRALEAYFQKEPVS